AHRDAQGRGLPVRGRLMLPALLHAIRRSIALKLTLTLIGFVGISLIAAGIYLNQALETFAVEALEARLATAARLLMEDARGLVARRAGPDAVRAFPVRARGLSRDPPGHADRRARRAARRTGHRHVRGRTGDGPGRPDADDRPRDERGQLRGARARALTRRDRRAGPRHQHAGPAAAGPARRSP